MDWGNRLRLTPDRLLECAWASCASILLAFLIVAIFGLAGVRTSRGQHLHHADHCRVGDFGCQHKEFHGWYQSAEDGKPLMQPPNPTSSCCTDDGRPTKARSPSGDENDWEAMIDGKWEKIPLKVIKDKHADGVTPLVNPTGLAHIFATRRHGNWTPKIYCFVKPPSLVGIPRQFAHKH